MKFSAPAVLAAVLALDASSCEAFVLPQTRVPSSTSTGTALASAAGDSFKRGIKFLLVPNAKPKSAPSPPAGAIVPDGTSPLSSTAPPAETVTTPATAATTTPQVAENTPSALPVDAVTPPPDVMTSSSAAVAATTTTTPVNPSASEGLPNNNPFQPVQGMQVDWTEKVGDSLRPNVQADWQFPHIDTPRPNVLLRGGGGGFDWGAWLQDKWNHAWQASSGPVNTGPPRVLERIDPDAAVQWRAQWENVSGQQFLASYDLFRLSVRDLAALLSSGTAYTQADFERALNLKETGAWYLAVAGTLGVAWWNVALRDDGSSAVAMPRGGWSASTTATTTADPEVKLRQLAQTDDALAKREAAVTDQVAELTAATAAVTQQLAELNAAKAQRDYDVATMKSDLREMRNELDVTTRSEQDLRRSLQRTQERLETETASLRQQLEERIQAEAAVREQLKANKDQMNKEMQTIATAKDQAEQEVVKAKKQVTSLQKEKQAMEQEIASLQAQVQALQEQLEGPRKATAPKGSKAPTSSPPSSPPVAAKTADVAVTTKQETKAAPKETVVAEKEKAAVAKKAEPEKAAAKEPKKAATKKSVKKSIAKKATKKAARKAVDTEKDRLETLSNAFFANITEPVGSAVQHKSAAPVEKETPPEDLAHSETLDWSSLSKTSLQRKKIKELQDYLKERVPVRVVTTHDDVECFHIWHVSHHWNCSTLTGCQIGGKR